MESKQQIRICLKKKRSLLTEEQTEQYSKRICTNLLNEVRSGGRQTVYFYYPLGQEVDLLPWQSSC